MIVVKALSGSLRSKYVQSVGKQTIFDWQLQLVKSRSIYGFHLAPELFIRINLFYYITFLICRYNPSDVVKLARTVVEGKLPKPDQPIYVEKKDCFPSLLAYEHKYNYKLKFLTDLNVSIFGNLTITNFVVLSDTQLHAQLRRPFSISEYDPWSRHSICSLEGDILISNIESPDRGNDDYLIPSLLLLKQKVDLVFGSQPIISLSNDRKELQWMYVVIQLERRNFDCMLNLL